MRILALDAGEARCGCAVCDPTETVVTPLDVGRAARTRRRGLDTLARLVREREIEQIVVGLPLTMRGEEGEQARWTRRFAERLAERVDVPVEMHDERLTTRQAERSGGTARGRLARRGPPARGVPDEPRADEPPGRRRPRSAEERERARLEREARRAAQAGRAAAPDAAAAPTAEPPHRPPPPQRTAVAEPPPPPHRRRRRERRPPGDAATAARAARPRTNAAAASCAAAAVVLVLFAAWFLLSLFQPFKGDGEGARPRRDPDRRERRRRSATSSRRTASIASAFFFRARVTLGGSRGDLKPGHYRLKHDMSYGAAIDALSEGPPKNIVTVTIPEGRSRAEIAPIVEGAGPDGQLRARERAARPASTCASTRPAAPRTSRASCSRRPTS